MTTTAHHLIDQVIGSATTAQMMVHDPRRYELAKELLAQSKRELLVYIDNLRYEIELEQQRRDADRLIVRVETLQHMYGIRNVT